MGGGEYRLSPVHGVRWLIEVCVCVGGGGVEYRLSPVHGVRGLIGGCEVGGC